MFTLTSTSPVESEAEEDEDSDVIDNEELEFMLYSQIHYVETELQTVNENTPSNKANNIPIKTIANHSDLDSLLYNVTDKSVGNKAKRKHLSDNNRKDEHKKRLKNTNNDIVVISDLEDNIVINSDSDNDVHVVKVTDINQRDLCRANKQNIVNKKKDIHKSREMDISLKGFQKEVIMKSKVYGIGSIRSSESETDSESECSLNTSSDSDYHMDHNCSQDKYHLITNFGKESHNPSFRDVKKKVPDTSGKWTINEQDSFSGIAHVGDRKFGRALGGRYFKPSAVQCHNCKDTGHLSKDCRKPKKSHICIQCGSTGHYFRSCPESICYRCNQPGHNAARCQIKQSNKFTTCRRCRMPGHSTENCPDFWRQFHITTSQSKEWPPQKVNNNAYKKKKSCSNCGSRNHYHFNCGREGMDQHSLPTYTLVAEYDSSKALKKYFTFDLPTKGKIVAPKKKKKKDHQQQFEYASPFKKVKKNKHKSQDFMKYKMERNKYKKKKKKSKEQKIKKAANSGFNISKTARKIMSR